MEPTAAGAAHLAPDADPLPLSSATLRTGPLLLWLGVQFVALVVPALRVPLAAKYPYPAELLAVAVMLAAQVGAGSLLFPALMPNRATAAAVVAATWPFQMVAALLSARAPAQVVVPGLYVTAWLLALAVWRAALTFSGARLWGVAVSSAVSMGGASLWYLRREFVPDDAPEAALFGPLLSAISLTDGEPDALAVWLWPASAFAVGAVIVARDHIVRQRRVARLQP